MTQAGQASAPTSVLDFTMNTLDGEPIDLSQYKGKVILIVNTASKCGFTGQYDGLQKVYEQYRDQGFVVLGFPANNFGGQEPGTNAEIATFCRQNYGVSFPMFSKISVKGDNTHPLFAFIARQPEPIGGEPRWNFTKFLVDRSGNLVQRYESSVKPDARQVTARIEQLLGA